MRMVRFFESRPGRVARIAAGVVLVGLGVGLSVSFGGAWWVFAAVGLVPLLAGLFNVCLIGPLFREPMHRASHAA